MPEEKMRIAIQGEFGSFSHEAALLLVPEATIVPCALSPEVFTLVENQGVSAAVIPIENSIAGSVTEHFDLLFQRDVQIERESLLRIRHNLIGLPGAELLEIRQVFSHPVALAQCRRFLLEHPRIGTVPFYDTAGSVKRLVESGERASAAIASEQAARFYGGEILAEGIEDNPANFTRFFLVRRRGHTVAHGKPDKVSVAFIVENRAGALASALQAFAQHNTNLTKIESRPVQGQPWQYVFYADCQMQDPDQIRAALEALRRECLLVRELGCYPSATAGA